MVGDIQVLVENHRGIIVYTSELVRLNTSIGELEISGLELTLKNILPDEIILEGRVNSVIFRK